MVPHHAGAQSTAGLHSRMPFEQLRCRLQGRGFQLVQSNRVLVREVLIQRANRQSGMLGDAVRGPRGITMLRENVSSGIQDPLTGLGGPVLCRLLAGPKSVLRGRALPRPIILFL